MPSFVLLKQIQQYVSGCINSLCGIKIAPANGSTDIEVSGTFINI